MITDRQVKIDISGQENRYDLTYRRKSYAFPTLENMQNFFLREMPFDTVKVHQDGENSYYHLSDHRIEIYTSKKALREALNHESGGVWCEEKEGKKRYFISERGWLKTSYREVSEEFLLSRENRHGLLSLQKTLYLGLVAFRQVVPLFFLHQASAYVPEEEFRVNNYTQDAHRSPSVAARSDGGFVVVWSSFIASMNSTEIFAKQYSNGSVMGEEFRVNSYLIGSQTNPSVDVFRDNGFVVTWDSEGQDGDGTAVIGQRFSGLGDPRESEFLINNFTRGNQLISRVCILDNENFMVAWQSLGQLGQNIDIFGQHFERNGTPIGGEFQINTFTDAFQFLGNIAVVNGVFLVVWSSSIQDGGTFGVYAQAYDAVGIKIGGEARLNLYTNDRQEGPNAAGLTNGNFVVVWQSFGQDGDGYGIFANLFQIGDTSISSITNGFQVNSHTQGDQKNPAVAPLEDRGFVVVWESEDQDGDGGGIYGQRFDLDSSSIGEEFRVNDNGIDHQGLPAVAGLRGEGFVVVWESWNQDGSQYGIYAKVFDIEGIATNSTSFISQVSTSITSVSTETTERSESVLESQMPEITYAIYGIEYEVVLEGFSIGTYVLTGGTGNYNPMNANVLTVQFDSDYIPVEGDVITLFTFAELQGDFPEIVIEGIDTECISYRLEIEETSSQEQAYQLIFEGTNTCTTSASQSVEGAIATLLATN